ncbi:GAF domain-containing protein [Anaeromyxobacter terrae]|uniref:GAF domain-containing protein n=1 Tax=Anaeromyxobacter terrae TaxID=2925406 RepID=UPI001F5754BA|nr:GAF domain-containing protein [Anaeromyxobacter sp. SG22]
MLTPEQLTRLLELARALSGTVDHADVAAIAAERARVLTGAAAAQLAEMDDGDELAPIAESPGDVPARPSAPLSTRASEPAREAARTRTAIWIASRAEARAGYRNVPLVAFGGGPEHAAWAFLPLVADDALGGVLTLAFDEAPAFDPSTRAFLAEVASACANALARGSLFARERDRADASDEARASGEVRQLRSDRLVDDRTHLFERERFARARAEAEAVVAVHLADSLERAQRLTAALAHAETEEDVVAALAAQGLDGFGAALLTLARRTAGGGLELVPLAGVPASAPAPVDPASPEAEVFRTASALWLDAPERVHRFPAAAHDPLAGETGSWLGAPLPGPEGARGVLALAFPYGRAFTPGDRARLTLLAEECASALSRCAVRDAEAAARAAALSEKLAKPLVTFVVQYEEEGRDRPDARVLGVFSSEAAAREALRELDRTRSLLVRAWITSWALDVPLPVTRVEVALAEA